MAWLGIIGTVLEIISSFFKKDENKTLLDAGKAIQRDEEYKNAREIKAKLDGATYDVDELLKPPSERKQ